MKKLLAVIIVMTLLLPCSVFAVESITWSIVEKKTAKGGLWAEVTSTIVAAANGSVTNTILGGTAGGAGTKYDLRGRYLYSVCIGDNGTNPTDNSDLALRHGGATGRDLLGLAGTDKIDSGASLDNNCFQPAIDSSGSAVPVYDSLYQVITNNSVDGGQIIIKYQFIE